MSQQSPPAGPPPGPTGPPPAAAADRDRRADRAALLRDWAGPALVAGAVLGTSLVLAVVLGLLMRPAGLGVTYGARTTVTYLAWLWASTFGADLTAHATILGADLDVGLGTFPLTLTVASLAAGIVVLRRRTAAYGSPLAALGLVAKAALLTALPLLVVSWACFSDLSSLTRLAGFAAPARLGTARVGASSTGSFFLTFLVVTIGLGCGVLARDTWVRPGPLGAVAHWIAAPLRGLAVLLVGLVVAGLVGAVFVWIFRIGGAPTPLHPSVHQWVNIAAAVIVYAGNLGLALVTLGAGGSVGFSATAQTLGQHAEAHRLAWWAGDQGINAGLWVALALTPLVLAAAAYVVARGRDLLRGLAVFVVSLLVTVPVLVHIASVHAHVSLDLGDAQGIGRGLLSLLGLSATLIGPGWLALPLSGSRRRRAGRSRGDVPAVRLRRRGLAGRRAAGPPQALSHQGRSSSKSASETTRAVCPAYSTMSPALS